MRLAYTFIGIMLLGFCFELIDFDSTIHYPFKFYHIGLTLSTYIWMALEKIILIWLVWVIIDICQDAGITHLPAIIFLWVQIGDLIDWALTYNTPYWSIKTNFGVLPISYNVISFFVYAIFVIWYGSCNLRNIDTD